MSSNTGFQRATTLTIVKKDNGVEVSTAIFDMKLQFVYSGSTYPAVTNDDIQKMTLIEYNTRVEAYASYITEIKQNDYPGLIVTSVGSRIENTIACPIS